MTQKILVLDNSPEYRQLLEQVVVGMGYKACVTDGATEAWKILQTDPHDLILMDVKMPAVQGDQFLKYIRKMLAKPFTIRRLAAEIHETIGEPDG